MPMKLLSADAFRDAAKGGQRPEGTVFRFAAAEPQTVGDAAARTKRFVFSDATIDHAGDSIDPKGWNLAIFKRNPVALFSHMSWDPPIGRASNVSVQGDQLVGDIEFATADVYDFADTIYRLVDGGFLKAVSVGFKPDDYEFSRDKDRPYGIDFKKQTLLEISVCPVPCNPNALGEARSLGVDTRPLVQWAERVLDTGGTAFLPRAELEQLRGQAGGVQRRFYLAPERSLTAEAAERLRAEFKRWHADPGEALILPPGVELREIGGREKADGEDWKCGADRELPLDEDGAWDGPAAEGEIFDHAGGDDFNPVVARKAFLAYDASAPKLRGSYKLPFARVVGGKLTAMASGIRAAASRLPQADIPEDVKTTARGVLDHYEAQMKGGKSLKAGRRISAATKAKLEEAMAHHAAATKCVMDAMDPPDEPAGADDDDRTPSPQPPGSVAPEDDGDKNLTPQERRLRRVARLRASIAAD